MFELMDSYKKQNYWSQLYVHEDAKVIMTV